MVVTGYQQPTLPRWDWQASGADKHWLAMYAKMDLSYIFGWPLWEKEVFEVLGKHFKDLKLIFQEYSKTGSAGSATADQLFTMQKTELNNLSLDCGLANADFAQVRVMAVFERADKVDEVDTRNKKAKSSQVQLAQEAKMVKERSKDLGKNKAKAKVVDDNGLEFHEFLECLVNMSFQRANPKYGQVGKTDVAAGGIELELLPSCLENMLKNNILLKAKRDQVPGWLAEIQVSKDCQKVIDVRREKMRMRWRFDAGKGEQGAQMDNKEKGHSDTGLSMDLPTFVDAMNDRGLMKDLFIAPQPPVVGMAVEKVHLNLSALDIKAAFAGAQSGDETLGKGSGDFKQGQNANSGDKLQMGNANHKVNFDEWMLAIALCGHMKYVEVKGSTMSQRVAGALDNYIGRDANEMAIGDTGGRSEKQVLSEILYPAPPRTQIAKTAKPPSGMPAEQHALFLTTWKGAMDACLDIDVIGFPLWEEAVFKLMQANFDEIASIFANYSQSISGGSLQASALQATTMQDNELISFCRDAGLINEKFSNARVQSLMKDVGHAFKGAGGTGGSGVYSEGIALPAFFVLLLLIALNRANPKLGQIGEAGEQAVDAPLPGCLEAILTNNILKKAKRSKLAGVKSELRKADPKGKLFEPYKAALKKDFDAACKKREKMPAVALFAKVMMSKGTLVADLKDRGVIVAKNVKGKPAVTGASAECEVALSALDVESAFTLCQAGAHGDKANDTIEFDEFLLALGMCGCAKYAAVEAMSVQQKVEAAIAEYLGKASVEDVVANAAPAVERFDPSTSTVIGFCSEAFLGCWSQMGDGLAAIGGFPTWEPAVFDLLANAFDDLEPLFRYYAGDSPGMQQAEFVDLALDSKLATSAFPIAKVVALFEQVNIESGGGDADFELFEFLTFLVRLAFAKSGPDPSSLEAMLAGLRRSVKVVDLKAMLAGLDGEATGAIASGEAALAAGYAKAAGAEAAVGERALLQYLEGCKQIRSVIVTLAGGAEGSADLTWQDASAAFLACGGGQPLSKEAFSQCMALCGMVKYGGVDSLSPAQKVEGFLANLAGSKDEHAVIG